MSYQASVSWLVERGDQTEHHDVLESMNLTISQTYQNNVIRSSWSFHRSDSVASLGPLCNDYSVLIFNAITAQLLWSYQDIAKYEFRLFLNNLLQSIAWWFD